MRLVTAINEVAALYETHGWTLRRVLLTQESRGEYDGAPVDRPDVDVFESDLDSLWFSRRSTPGSEAWELRRLTGTPFALVTVIPDGTPDDELDAALAEVEEQMSESVNRRLPTLEDVEPTNGNQKKRQPRRGN